MIQDMVRAFLLIFIAEMGDKTQILALAFATRYPVRKVLIGIGLGAFLNHGLAVVLGSYLSQWIPVNTIQMIAGAAFVGFALWTLKPDNEEEEEEPKIQFGPTVTVAVAFFLGELGDKTQLTAITLAADAAYPVMILAGTVSGMIATGALGIFVGKKLGDKIPELGIRLLAAAIFMFFGLQKLCQTVPGRFLNGYIVIPVLSVLALTTFLMVRTLIRRNREGIRSDLAVKSKRLRDYYLHMKEDLDNICLGRAYCQTCQGNKCAVGRSKEIVQAALNDRKWDEELKGYTNRLDKPFIKEEVLDCLVDTLMLIGTVQDEKQLNGAHMIRNHMEEILFGHKIKEFKNVESYIEKVREIDTTLSDKMAGILRMRTKTEKEIAYAGSKP
jgi:putative Ca2+/H+ antiporter (TMEM165/GDT1 family)